MKLNLVTTSPRLLIEKIRSHASFLGTVPWVIIVFFLGCLIRECNMGCIV